MFFKSQSDLLTWDEPDASIEQKDPLSPTCQDAAVFALFQTLTDDYQKSVLNFAVNNTIFA